MDSCPCGVCAKECTDTMDVACDHCNQWLHYPCEKLTHQEFSFLRKTALPYICRRCLYKESVYNFDKALQRLSVAASQTLLDEAAHLERIFLRGESLHAAYTKPVLYHNLTQDLTAKQLLNANWTGPTPVEVSGDGNCLFNAISVAIIGNESAAAELRLMRRKVLVICLKSLS